MNSSLCSQVSGGALRCGRTSGRRVHALLPALLITLSGCLVQPARLVPSDADRVLARRTIDAENPGEPGQFSVLRLYYGSGSDRRRPEYRDSIAYTTASVDASAFVSFTPGMAKSRRKYWGFDTKAFPRNGRVWYPDAPGPFPLVLVVHGNHDMREFSDPGYAWLGELLASRGFIVASVDENFLNGAARNENDARGWMLLKHLEVFRAINDSLDTPLGGRIDLSRIALMGHSRGGEAVAVAGAFNRLAHYPDDATQRFDFGFDIKGLIAIAPVDGQYKPADKGTPLNDVNYLVVHGSHDGDVSVFSGLTQYNRVAFSPDSAHFKSAIWMYRANHGQWNTVWNDRDNGRASGRRLNLGALVSGEEQRRFGRVMMSAFLETVLHGREEYRALFRDHRTAGDWLPPTMYLTQYSDGSARTLAHFEEDIDVTTGSTPGVTLRGDSLSVWREFDLPSRYRNNTLRRTAARLGWNNRPAEGDSAPRWPARFSVSVPDSLRRAWSVDTSSAVLLSLAFTDVEPGPRKVPKDSANSDSTTTGGAAADSSAADSAAVRAPEPSPKKKPRPKAPPKDTTPPDLTVELEDANGRTVALPLSTFGPVRRPVESYVLRRRGRDKSTFATLYERVLPTYVMPIRHFVDSATARATRTSSAQRGTTTAAFDASTLSVIRLLFDRTVVGEVIVDDIEIARAHR